MAAKRKDALPAKKGGRAPFPCRKTAKKIKSGMDIRTKQEYN